MENEKMEGTAGAESVDISLILELIGVGSLDEGEMMLKSYLETHDPDPESYLVQICIDLGAGELVRYIEGEDVKVQKASLARLYEKMEDIRVFERDCLNAEGQSSLWRFLGDYLALGLKSEEAEPRALYDFLCTLSNQERACIAAPYILSGGSIIRILEPLLDEEEVLAFAKQLINSLYAFDKKTYGREGLALGRYYVSKGKFTLADELLKNASYHLDELSECRFLLLLVALGARDEEGFVRASGFSKSMPEYMQLMGSLGGKPTLIKYYTDLANRNLEYQRTAAAPKELPTAQKAIPTAPKSAPRGKSGKGIKIFLAIVLIASFIGMIPHLFPGIMCTSMPDDPSSHEGGFVQYEDGVMLVEIQEEYFDGFYYHIPSSYNGYDVVAIGEGALGDGRIRILDIPASVRHIEERAFADATALMSITVDENNMAFKSMDDVLYSADGKNLVCYPQQKNARDFYVPKHVEKICSHAFYGAWHLENLYLPTTVAEVESYAISNSSVTVCLEHEEVPSGFAAYWAEGVEIVHKTVTPYYERIGNIIYFGEYPQTLKAYDVSVYEDIVDERGYYLGSDGAYYAKVEATRYPYADNEQYYFSDGSYMYENVTYYFKVEPIRWRIIEDGGSEALLLCDSILDSSMFGQPNSYKESVVRKFLLESFYPKAFNAVEGSMILESYVDNSEGSTGYPNPYACENTEDKIFLLSFAEATDSWYGFCTEGEFDEVKRRHTSDYAMAVGTLKLSDGSGYWWLRSPYYEFDGGAALVWSGGEAAYYISSTNSGVGIVPALRLNLTHDVHYFENGVCVDCGEVAYTRDGDYIYIGEYPQSVKSEDVYIISDSTDSRGYYLGSDGAYYAQMVANPYASDLTYANGTAIEERKIYFFKVEPIRWRIVSGKSGDTALVVCDSILESRRFDDDFNHYAQSELRGWLNGRFYQTAFSASEREAIRMTVVDNSGEYSMDTNGNIYAIEDTEDHVFLLSRAEVTEQAYGFSSDHSAFDTARRLQTSDYARACGAWTSVEQEHYGQGYWWLRSPLDSNSSLSLTVHPYGNADANGYVNSDDRGVVAAMYIDLNHIHTESVFTEEERTEADCYNDGSYLSVERCVDCGEQLSAMWVTIPKGHKCEKDFLCTLCGETVEYYRDGDYIYMGEYPQSLKADDVEILSDSTDTRGYYLGSDGYYYAKVTAAPYAWEYTFSTGEEVAHGGVYYFKVEPIRWRILTEDGANAFLFCDIILDEYTYDSSYSPSNSYHTSMIRAWLNDTFYRKAFNESQRRIALTTIVDNSEYSTGDGWNNYACEDTEDKLFLLSYREAIQSDYGFVWSASETDEARRKLTSDYARAVGAYMDTSSQNYGRGYWWLRSPDPHSNSNARVVMPGGVFAGVSNGVRGESIGVVPAMWIHLEHTPAMSVEENQVGADLCTDGSYDEVVYCTGCDKEFSRVNIRIAAPHDIGSGFVCRVCDKEVDYYRDNDYIYMGEYPQSLKADDVEILSDSVDSRGYYYGTDGYYYAKIVASPHFSVDCFSSGGTVTKGAEYYFKVEPIRWRILAQEHTRAFLLCDSIIESMAFDADENNYMNSDIRAWLNATFYEQIFSALQKEIILTTPVDNSLHSTGDYTNDFVCEDTEDKLFLLSHRELLKADYGFAWTTDSPDLARRLPTSDYARATGIQMSTDPYLYGNGYWWIRTPSNSAENYARYIGAEGTSSSNSDSVSSDCYGVVPAMWIQL